MTAVVFPFSPHWGDGGITERLQFNTRILGSETFAEQRAGLRTAPRREFEAPMYLVGRERQLFDLSIYARGAQQWLLPIWPEVQLLPAPLAAGASVIPCDTAHLEFAAGGRALLRGEQAWQHEVVTIDSIDGSGLVLDGVTIRSWPAGTRLYPLRLARLIEQPQLTRITDVAQRATVRFLLEEVSDWTATMPATLYRSRPVLATRPDESEDLTSRYERLLQFLDNGSALPAVTDTAGVAMPVLSWRWIDLGRAARAQLRSLIYALDGRRWPVWLPTHADDLSIAASASAGSNQLDVANVGVTLYAGPGRRDLRIELFSGAVLHRRITSATELSADIERLTLDSTHGVALSASTVARISWLSLCRLADDTVEFEHVTDSEGVARCALTFRGVRDDEF